MKWLLVTDLQIRAKHSGCRSQYLHTAKKAIPELYKLNIQYPTACAPRVEYLLAEDRFICPRAAMRYLLAICRDWF